MEANIGNKEDVSLSSCSYEKTICMEYYTLYASNKLIYILNNCEEDNF